ncbi:MAG: hypothetical protein WCA35_30710, partial [Kovacikia sp.]
MASLVSILLNLPHPLRFGDSHLTFLIALTNYWKPFIFLGEPTIQREDGSRFITARDGTSFACPHVAHAAAIAASSLEKTVGQRPSANLIRALVGSATYSPPCPPDWLG